MKKYISRKNIGWLLTIILSLLLAGSIYGKLSQHPEALAMLDSNNLGDWITIIGIGELVALVLFIIPQTMRLGALLLAAYFGGAIVYHMAHPDEALTGFLKPAVFLLVVFAIAWIRGMDLIFVRNKEAFDPQK